MLKKITDNKDPSSLTSRLRRKRFSLFLSLLAKLQKPLCILDVGGTQRFWEVMNFPAVNDIHFTLLNLTQQPVTRPNFSSLVGDARKLLFPDRSFDIVFSNSVIEHLSGHEDKIKMAQEIRRVGKRYFVQTPNRYFPLEPHFIFPFFQFLPVEVRIWLLRHFNLGRFHRVANYQKAKSIIENISLLGRKEILELFPDATLFEEKIFGITKSFVLYAGWE
jgi:SAM-dependent methyltransferase